MKILTAIQMAKLDEYTIKNEPVTSIGLMERAANALCDEIRKICMPASSLKIFAGPGNNGGDALAVARLLAQDYRVEVFLFNTSGQLSNDCRENMERLTTTCPDVAFHEITDRFEMPDLDKNDWVIDGLFGTGLNKAISGGFALLIKSINNAASKVISIDIPSGLMCEDNTYSTPDHIIHADYTLTIQCLKPAFMMADNRLFLGIIKILDIGLLINDISFEQMPYSLIERTDAKDLLKKRDPFGNKGTFGHGLLIAGSYGMAGAAVIAARACMHSGIGKLTIHTPKANSPILQVAVPEAVVHHDEDNSYFTSIEKMDGYNALAIGPGLSDKKDTAIAFIDQINHTQKPLVIDADGLNILAGHKGWIQQIPPNTILTPHPKEFIRLFGNSLSAFDLLNQAREQAEHQSIYIILKGHFTAICCPNGHIYFNTTGNSGMATAGTGDALTGILLSLLSQGYQIENACVLAVYLHGLAGDLAAKELTEEGMTVNDLIHYLPYAIKELKN